ncbi:MaoC family dehydratase [Paracoccus sediminicola]|uniref:MaoC family dehydratase n=1 Tax=Paracoccus sediminicola TaxID=3017783 RepID=UPI0022F1041F|nr:MaoC family dehydratase [Paracoccus sediminicola]WBU56227.1 MaoC/PaaZ C-terminal domain-containing protein [Paracoccus sediminicola]
MALNAVYLASLKRPEIIQKWTAKDAALYALGLGYGDDPTDSEQLRFLDRTKGMDVMPAMANVLCYDGSWLRDPEAGIDYSRVVHGEQEMVLHAPLPLESSATGKTVIEELIDKGEGRGALIVTARELKDARTGQMLATIRHTIFCRGAGGFGGSAGRERSVQVIPDGDPDGSVEIKTQNQLALIYRLSGDFNPLHSDPEVARKVGYDRPILHGLSTFGIACRALMRELAGNDPLRVRLIRARFSAPVYPGEAIVFDYWRLEPGSAAFSARVPARDASVLANGRFEYIPGE